MNIWITGPESCGKTELAQFLCEQIPNSVYVEEFARSFLEKKIPPFSCSYEELKFIVAEQIAIWRSIEENTKDVYVFDSDILVLKIWVEEVYGEIWPEIESVIQLRKTDLVLLCKPDVPWVSDPLRTNPHDRSRLFDKYIFYLNKYNLPHEIIHGSFEEREKIAIELIRSRFAVDKTEES
jgi:nicotinamide riboside kinase